jgi:hypothetical protein
VWTRQIPKVMTPQKIQTLFDFIDYLDNNKKEYIDRYIPLCNEIENLLAQKSNLNPNENYKDKQKFNNLQNQINEKSPPHTSNIFTPISNKLIELGIWSGDNAYASIWNNNISAINDFKENFTSDDVARVMLYKQKYLNFRAETKSDFLGLGFIFNSLDEIFKDLFSFFKDTNENEFDSFETKTIKVNSLKEVAIGLRDGLGKNVKFSISPDKVLYSIPKETQVQTYPTNIKSEIIMGDKIQVGDIPNNSGQITIGKDQKTKSKGSDEYAKKSFHWQKWGVIVATILALIAIVVTMIIS